MLAWLVFVLASCVAISVGILFRWWFQRRAWRRVDEEYQHLTQAQVKMTRELIKRDVQ